MKFPYRYRPALVLVAALALALSLPEGVSAETREEFLRKVRVGMTKEEVRDSIGMPKHFAQTKAGDFGRLAYWEQRTTDERNGITDQFTNLFIDDAGRVMKISFTTPRSDFERKLPKPGSTKEDVLKALGPPDIKRDDTWTYDFCTCSITNLDDREAQVLGGRWQPIWKTDRSVILVFAEDGQFRSFVYNNDWELPAGAIPVGDAAIAMAAGQPGKVVKTTEWVMYCPTCDNVSGSMRWESETPPTVEDFSGASACNWPAKGEGAVRRCGGNQRGVRQIR